MTHKVDPMVPAPDHKIDVRKQRPPLYRNCIDQIEESSQGPAVVATAGFPFRSKFLFAMEGVSVRGFTGASKLHTLCLGLLCKQAPHSLLPKAQHSLAVMSIELKSVCYPTSSFSQSLVHITLSTVVGSRDSYTVRVPTTMDKTDMDMLQCNMLQSEVKSLHAAHTILLSCQHITVHTCRL